MASFDEQRLAFGAVAELYDHARPSYPTGAIDDLVAQAGLSPGDRVVDVGAGTGKATVLLAQRGLRVVAIEPDADMAAVARVACSELPEVEIVEAEFERWQPSEPATALVSAQAWHWIAPETRYLAAHGALVPGGTLAAIWTFPDWDACALRDQLRGAYRAAAPELAADFPMHPGSLPARLAGDWEGEIAAGATFHRPRVIVHAWTQHYARRGYAELVQTHQDHIRLASEVSGRLLTAIGDVIDSAGGTLAMPFVTRVCLATRR